MKKATLASISLTSSKNGGYYIVPSLDEMYDGDRNERNEYIRFDPEKGMHAFDTFEIKDDKVSLIEFKSSLTKERKSEARIKDIEQKLIKKSLVNTYNFENFEKMDIVDIYSVVGKITNNDVTISSNAFEACRDEFIRNNNLNDENVLTWERFVNIYKKIDAEEFIKKFDVTITENPNSKQLSEEIFEQLMNEFKYTDKRIKKYGPAFNQEFMKKVNEWVANTKASYSDKPSMIIKDLLFDIKIVNNSLRDYVERKYNKTTKEMHVEIINNIINKYP